MTIFSSTPPTTGQTTRLRELALLFLRLGTTAFGGPAAHIAIMEDEVVTRRKWLSRDEFLDLLGATNLIPGPNSTEMAIHVGHRRAGWPGLLVAGICFILPATIIVGVIAWAYMRYGSLPQVRGVLYGVKPVVIAIVFQALWRLGPTALKDRLLMATGAAAVVLGLAGVNELTVLLAAGLAVVIARTVTRKVRPPTLPIIALVAAPQGLAAAVSYSPLTLFLFFVKVGAVLYGSGYVLLAFLRGDLVERWGWITESQLLDAVAVGQVTPGPLFTTATFIGYVLDGPRGALWATVGIFLPAFVFVALSGPLIPRLRRSPVAGAMLDGVNVGSLALMAVVTLQLARSSLIDPLTAALAVVSGALLLAWKVNSTWLILAGAVAGLAWGA